MQTSVSLSRRLIESGADPDALRAAYAEYLRSLLSEPLWSPEHPAGSRIPWRLAAEAAQHRTLADSFSSPGIYMFGSSAGVPLYLGMTGTPLWQRLSKRYVRGKRSQCQLAADYGSELIARGIGGFPEEIRAWYRRQHKTNTARLRGAVAFTQHGIEGIWFALIPVPNPVAVRELEKELIPAANAWNRTHGHPPLVNVQDI